MNLHAGGLGVVLYASAGAALAQLPDLRAGDTCQVTYHDGTERRAVVQQYGPAVVQDGLVWVSVDDDRRLWVLAVYRVEELRYCRRGKGSSTH